MAYVKKVKETLTSYKNKEMIVDTVISNKQSYFTIYDRRSKEIRKIWNLEKYVILLLKKGFTYKEIKILLYKWKNYEMN